jgi:hypothetical protein
MASSNHELNKNQTKKLLNNDNNTNNFVNSNNNDNKIELKNNNDTVNIELHETTSNTVKVRDEWSNKVEYMLSVIGYVVDLGNLQFIV